MYRHLASEKKKCGCGFYLLWKRHGSIIVCMLCTQVASLQRSTLHISNWKIFFKGKECYNWESLRSGCWLHCGLYHVTGDECSCTLCRCRISCRFSPPRRPVCWTGSVTAASTDSPCGKHSNNWKKKQTKTLSLCVSQTAEVQTQPEWTE